LSNNVGMILITICLLNFIINSLILGIIIFRDWEVKKVKTKDIKILRKQKIIKVFKIIAIILLALILFMILDVALSFVTRNKII
jgi:hypothetical protein